MLWTEDSGIQAVSVNDSQFSKGGIEKKREGGAFCVEMRPELHPSLVLLLVSTVLAVPTEALLVRVEEAEMHRRCSRCKAFPSTIEPGSRCCELGQSGHCKHVRTVYPPD